MSNSNYYYTKILPNHDQIQSVEHAILNVEQVVGGLSASLFIRTIEAFSNALMFIVAFQANDIIRSLLDDNTFDRRKLLIVLVAEFAGIILSMFKDSFIKEARKLSMYEKFGNAS